jgi:hypothetical protein
LRVFAIETNYRNKINFSVISERLTQETLHKYLEIIKVKNLCTYKGVNIKKARDFRKQNFEKKDGCNLI